MPYEIQMDNEDCQGHAVVKLDDGRIMGCHETHEEAEAQLTALNIAEAEENNQEQEAEELSLIHI